MGRQRQWLPASVIAHLMTLPLWMAAPAVWALSVDLEGVEGEVARNIRAYLQNIEEDEYTESRLEVEIRQRIEAAIRVYGYYEPDISIDLLKTVTLA